MYHDTLIPVAAVMSAVAIPFIMRALQKGEGNVITTNNVYNMKNDISNIEKKLEEGFKEIKRAQQETNTELKLNLKDIYEKFSVLTNAINLHGQTIKTLEQAYARLEERVRDAETEIIRNERRTTRSEHEGSGGGGTGRGFRSNSDEGINQ